MDQEKFASVNQQPSSNPNLSRVAAETLKLIQKKGLSISVVKSNSGVTPPTHTDTRSKQCLLSVEKSQKMTPVIPRTQTATENKIQSIPTRLISTADTRVLASGRNATMGSFLEGKPSTNQTRPNQPSVPEGKVFNQNWNPSSSADKAQATISRPVMTTPVIKMQTSQVRTPTTDKNSVIRNNQVMHTENKSQARVAQAQRVALNQQLIEGKIQNNPDRVNINNSSDLKKIFNQSRTGQFPVSQDNKATPSRVVPQKVVEAKTTNPLSVNKSVDSKTPQVNRMGQNVKLMPDPSQNKPRPNFIPKHGGKPLVGNSPMIVEKKMVKQVTNVVDGNSTQTTQCKSSTQVRVHPSGLEASTAVQTKMICTTAVHTTKMIYVQNVQNVPDNKMFLQGAKVTSQTASDMIQKTATLFDMSSESSMHGTPVTSRVSTAKRSATVVTAPLKKKCLKQSPPSASDISNKSMDGPSISLPEDENANEAHFLNNLSSRTSRTGLTITPVGPTSSTVPSNPSSVTQEVRKTAESIEKSIYKNVENDLMKSMKETKAKARPKGKRRFAEPVCLTLSSDEDEEDLHMPINHFHSELSQQMYPQDSDESNESDSKYNEENPESDERWFPGVTDTNDHLFVQNQDMEDPQFPGVMGINENSPPEQYEAEDEDEEVEEEEEDEEEEEKEATEMEEDEEMPEDEMDESEMEEEEEVPPEEEEDQCRNSKRPTEFNNRPTELSNRPPDYNNKSTNNNMTVLSPPLLCRSVRVGSYKIHAKGNNQIMSVYLGMDGISFNAPIVSDVNKMVNVILKPTDVTHMLVHFGKCLPILFIFTTEQFAEAVRKSLDMSANDFPYYDPLSKDEKEKKITFLIDSVTEEQRNFLRHQFLSDHKIKEIDQKTANEILVKSTPSQNQYVKCEIVHKSTALPQPAIQPPSNISALTRENVIALNKQTGKCEVVNKVQLQLPTTQAQIVPIARENILAITAVQPGLAVKLIPAAPPQPAIKLLTYPPPPQTGGIAITNEDVYCLNEGEFLNDQIIDFYLKYVFNEKLSDYHREKTHIFSSYFYHRLTNKPDSRTRPGEKVHRCFKMKRHNQVKTWTRHVDIFSKDFIIIPVNQNVHWLLAIICYPSLVPEAAAESPAKQETPKVNKSSDNVTSTDDQEENKTAKEPNSTVDGGINPNSDENSTTSSNSMYEADEPDPEEPIPEAPDSSTHPDKSKRKKEVPCICIFDSLRGPSRSKIVTMLREYLEVEWKTKKGTRKIFDKNTMQGYFMQCPQQTNYSDCGVYLLQFVESFFENPLPYFDTPIPNLTNWFPKEKVASKRQELKDLILSLQKKYSASTSNATEDAPTQSQVVQTDNR